MTVHLDRIAVFDAGFAQVVFDSGILQELLEEGKAAFTVQIRIAEHLIDLRALNDIDWFAVLALGLFDGIRQVIVGEHIFREIFLLIDDRFHGYRREQFHNMKTEFKARPVYLQDDDRIKAHFLTCFIALFVYRILEKKLPDDFTTPQIVETLHGRQG